MAMKTRGKGARIDFNINIKQLKFGKVNNVCSPDQCFYASFFQKKQERLMLKKYFELYFIFRKVKLLLAIKNILKIFVFLVFTSKF